MFSFFGDTRSGAGGVFRHAAVAEDGAGALAGSSTMRDPRYLCFDYPAAAQRRRLLPFSLLFHAGCVQPPVSPVVRITGRGVVGKCRLSLFVLSCSRVHGAAGCSPASSASCVVLPLFSPPTLLPSADRKGSGDGVSQPHGPSAHVAGDIMTSPPSVRTENKWETGEQGGGENAKKKQMDREGERRERKEKKKHERATIL